jgi:hypothetical protein
VLAFGTVGGAASDAISELASGTTGGARVRCHRRCSDQHACARPKATAGTARRLERERMKLRCSTAGMLGRSPCPGFLAGFPAAGGRLSPGQFRRGRMGFSWTLGTGNGAIPSFSDSGAGRFLWPGLASGPHVSASDADGQGEGSWVRQVIAHLTIAGWRRSCP